MASFPPILVLYDCTGVNILLYLYCTIYDRVLLIHKNSIIFYGHQTLFLIYQYKPKNT